MTVYNLASFVCRVHRPKIRSGRGGPNTANCRWNISRQPATTDFATFHCFLFHSDAGNRKRKSTAAAVRRRTGNDSVRRRTTADDRATRVARRRHWRRRRQRRRRKTDKQGGDGGAEILHSGHRRGQPGRQVEYIQARFYCGRTQDTSLRCKGQVIVFHLPGRENVDQNTAAVIFQQ